ncbi:MAG: PP2C family protein-serine/threonine phosphatase [Rhodoglobus sp.]
MSREVSHQCEFLGVTVRFRFSGFSDRGAVRRINEDSFLIAAPVFVVADGMGGHDFGDRASREAIAAFADAVTDDAPTQVPTVLEAIRAANDRVVQLSSQSNGDTIAGTTLSGLAFVTGDSSGNYHWMAFNIGDSRSYRWDGRSLTQISVDHSVVQELVDSGQLTVRQAERHPNRHIVTRALGAAPVVDADVWLFPAHDRQRFLLCSDGLSKELDDEEIARIIVFHDAEQLRNTDTVPMSLAQRLVNAAVSAGGSDNVTVVIVESELVGANALHSDDDTLERGALLGHLEETRPRG